MLPRIYRSYPKLWDHFFSTDDLPEFFENDSFKSVPAVNIMENNDAFTIEVAAPGLDKKDFKINLENNCLTISSEQENNIEEVDDKVRRREFQYSNFSRSFTLPESIESEKIKANHKDGILYVSIPKKEEAKVKPARQISIS